MQPYELKALLQKTNEVAAYPIHIEAEIPYHLNQPRRNRWNQPYCPTGLFRAVVIEDGHKWIEKRPISACGTTDFNLQRKNGVLVEFDASDLEKAGATISQNVIYWVKRSDQTGPRKPYPHTKVVQRPDGSSGVQMIVSRKVIFSDWTSYTLIEAERQVEREKEEAREHALREPQAALMGMSYEEFDSTYITNTKKRKLYLAANYEPLYKYNSQGRASKTDREAGKLEITLDRANQILLALKEISQLATVNDEPGSPTEQIRLVLADLLPESK